jgi:hypothetical protein
MVRQGWCPLIFLWNKAGWAEFQDYGLNKYIDTQKNVHLKNLPVKGLCGRCLSEFIDWRYNQSCRYSQSCWYFWPSFMNRCTSNLLSGSILPPPPLPSVNKNTVYTYTVCKGGGVKGSGPQADKHLPQSPFTGKFFRWSTFCIAFYLWVLSFYAHDQDCPVNDCNNEGDRPHHQSSQTNNSFMYHFI